MANTVNIRWFTKPDFNSADFCQRMISGQSIGSAYYIFKSNRTVYADLGLTEPVYTILQTTCAKIVSIKTTDNDIILGIDIGGKTCYIKYASYTVYTPDSSGRSRSGFTSLPTGYIGYTTVDHPSYISDSDLINSKTNVGASIFKSANKSINEVNPYVLINKATFSGIIDDTPMTAEARAIAATEAAAAANASTDIQEEDYTYAINVTPQYVYNIGEHLAKYKQIKRDENGNPMFDDDGNPIYLTDADGNPIETGGNAEFGRYVEKVNANGINYKNINSIFGAPYQFLPTTDCRIAGDGFSDDLEYAGYEFVERILSRMPLLYITPGNTSFMGGSSENARTALMGSMGVDGEESSSLNAMLKDYSGKLYTIMPAYTEYFNYVNPMCRAGAIFLGLTSTDPPKELNGVGLDVYHWGTREGAPYEIYIEEEETPDTEEEVTSTEQDVDNTETEEEEYDYTKESNTFQKPDSSLTEDLKQFLYYDNCIAFYINSEASFQDSFTNETGDTTLASAINGLSDKAREIQFLLGTASSAVGEAFDKVDGTLSDIKSQINNIVGKISKGNSIFSTIANSVKTIVSGGRMLFPQIWTNSTFSKSYNISIKLVSPSTDVFSWWLNIYVPLCHLGALVFPRSEYVNSYTAPFLVKAFYKGMFNIDMGIITEMSFTRGKEGSWTKDGLPTVVDVTFTIQDLYSAMGMTSVGSMFKGTTLQNVAEMDYLANLCGININEPDVFRMARLWATFNITNRVTDYLPNLSLNIGSSLRNKGMQIYNSLWGI